MKKFFLSFIYARRELRAGVRGFYIFLACLVLGTGAIAGVQSLSRGLIDSLHNDGRFILGGDIELRTVYQPATPEQLKFLDKNFGAVSTVMETRAMARSQDGKNVSLVELKAVDPFYPLYGKVEFADERGNPIVSGVQDMILPVFDTSGTGKELSLPGAVVEKELLPRMHLYIGDTLRIGKQDFLLRGIITKEPDRVGSQHFTLAPRVMISSFVFKRTGLAEQGNQVYYNHRLVMPWVRTYQDVLDAQQKITDAFPHAAWKGRNCFDASPQLEQRIKQLTQFLTLIGLATLLVGGIGISNAVRSFLEGKMANIATMKCLGASGAFVSRVYMSMIMMLAALGVGLGLGFGVAASKIAGSFLTAKFSLTDDIGIYPDALALAAAFGFLASFCFSLWPVGRAARALPNDLFRELVSETRRRLPLNTLLYILIAAQMLALLAIATSEDKVFAAWFMAAAAAVFLLFSLYAGAVKAVLRRLKFPVRPEVRMAMANLYRPGNVTSGVILSLGIGLTVLVAIALVEDNFSRLLTQDQSADTPSFFFLDIQPDQKDAFTALIAQHPSARAVQMTPSFRGRITAVNGKPPERALVDKNQSWVINSDRGFTWMKDLPAHSRLVAGQWWPADYSGPPLVSIATDVAKAFNVGVGDTLTLGVYGADVTAKIASVREVDWASFNMNFAIVFSPGLISKAPANVMATVAVAPGDEVDVQNEVAQKFPNVTVVRVRDALESAGTIVKAVAQTAEISAGVTLLAGALVLAGGIAAARRRHVYDAVILKVLGATRARILGTFLLEYGLLGVLAALIAAILGAGAAYAVLRLVMKLTWTFHPAALAAVTALCLALTLFAGFAGTWRALVQKPALWLRNQ